MLEEKLYEEHWQVASKALAVVEALCKSESCPGYFDYFADNLDAIRNLQESTKASVRDKSTKVGSLLLFL